MSEISLADFGSYTVGGRLHHVTEGEVERLPVTRDVTIEFDPRGHYAVEHGYVQYFVPARRNSAPPVLLLHGGGMSGTVWETTPDGRAGWLQHLLARGFETHVLDSVERGRAGFAPGLWPGKPILRTLEDAWTLFRFGPAEGFAARQGFAGQRFPIDRMDAFARSFAPRWLATGPAQVAVLGALLHQLEGPIVICHSQGAETAFAAVAKGAPVAGIVAVEPSAAPPAEAAARPATPLVVVSGDFLDSDFWQTRAADWDAMVARHPAAATRLRTGTDLPSGYSHMMMLDHGHEAVLNACIDTLGV